MSMNSRNTRFFWFMLILLGIVFYVGLMFVTTVDDCGRGDHVQKHWQSLPPKWVCGPG